MREFHGENTSNVQSAQRMDECLETLECGIEGSLGTCRGAQGDTAERGT